MTEDTQTLAQNVTRILGVIGFFGFAALGPLLYALAEPITTRASTPRPEWSFAAFRSGELAKAWEVHLTESSPLTVTLRAWHNDEMYRLGLLRSDRAVMGHSEWVFLGNKKDRSVSSLRRFAAQQKQFLDALKTECDRLGVQIFCVPVPDKANVYPDFMYPDGVMPPVRASQFGIVLADMAAAGIESVDLLTRFRELRRANSEVIYFQPRDTHWDWDGADAAAAYVADRLMTLGWDLGPMHDYVPMPVRGDLTMTDLMEVMGLLPSGRVSPELADRPRFAVLSRGMTAPIVADPEGARLAVCGDSFGSGLADSLRGYSGRFVDTQGVLPAKGPFPGLMQTLERVRRGETAVRVIVWEFIEREYFSRYWQDPPNPSGG